MKKPSCIRKTIITWLCVAFSLWFLAIASPYDSEVLPDLDIPPTSSRTIGVVGLKPDFRVEIERGTVTTPFVGIKLELERLNAEGFALRRMFSRSLRELEAERKKVEAAGLVAKAPDLGRWLIFEVPEGRTMEESLRHLHSLDFVDTAYAMPRAVPASLGTESVPNFKPQQSYLDPAPGGMDVKHVWKIAGGKGQKIMIADVEGDWNTGHNDLRRADSKNIDGRLMGGIWYNHGTAVLGVLVGSQNGFGITGIAHRAKVKMFSIGRTDQDNKNYTDVPDAINRAAAALKPGDVILLEVQYSGIIRDGDYIPVEYYDADFEAIQAAVAKGIVVVEAAGNGGQNLDKALYKNRFDPDERGDSGAIMVGAGAPPGSYRADRSRLYFSNYGERLNVQGWGESVTTTGYGDLYSKGGKHNYYTDSFNGTSSASGMVTGAAAVLQGVATKALGKPLKPKQLRRILVNTGSRQQGDTKKKIGPRPNLKKAAQKVINKANISGGKAARGREKR